MKIVTFITGIFKRIILLSFSFIFASVAYSQSGISSNVVMTPYIVNNTGTPNADKVLLDKLNRIVIEYGVGAENDLQSPFIITGHAIELNNETTATVPPRIAVDLTLTLYIGNGEDGTKFSSCSFNLRGVGNNLDKAYASAYRKIKVNSEELKNAMEEGKSRISSYYSEYGPSLLKKAKTLASSGNYAEAYGILLRIPSVCPQFNEAQDMVVSIAAQESDSFNNKVLSDARAAWSASPDENGASRASQILSRLSNPSDKIQKSADNLMREISTRLKKLDDYEKNRQLQMDNKTHALRMAAIKGATKIAVAHAKRPVYRVWWW